MLDTRLLVCCVLFTLGFLGACLVIVLEPRVTEVFTWVAAVHGVLAAACFATLMCRVSNER